MFDVPLYNTDLFHSSLLYVREHLLDTAMQCDVIFQFWHS